MFKKDSGDFKYNVVDGFDHIVDEKGNQTINLRKICWGTSTIPKVDIRKWIIQDDGTEVCGKGVSFMTEDGPNVLTEVLAREGYGNTYNIINNVSGRDDFRSALNKVLGEDDEYYDDTVSDPEEDYFDPREGLDLEE